MQHFPSISEEEFRKGCQIFYERVVNSSYENKDLSLQFTLHPGVLSIKKTYPLDATIGSKEEVTGTAQDVDDEATDDEDDEDDEDYEDDEDDEVGITMTIDLFGLDWSSTGHQESPTAFGKGRNPGRVLHPAITSLSGPRPLVHIEPSPSWSKHWY